MSQNLALKLRQTYILRHLAQHGKIRPKELCEYFNITRETAQNDLRRIRRNHPGIVELRYIGQSGYWCLVVEAKLQAA